MSETYLALLRGVNVGGKNKLPMKDLASLCAEIGCGNVRTYIQSGNVIFNADRDVESTLSAAISARRNCSASAISLAKTSVLKVT